MSRLDDIKEASDRAALERVFPVMKELRTHLDIDTFFEIYEEARATGGYKIVAIERAGNTIAVMGYRFITDYVRGKHLYIDDLVTTKDHRSAGHGARLLKWAEEEARKHGCTGLRLCTGIENEGGKRFYEREGWTLRSFAYTKKLPKPT